MKSEQYWRFEAKTVYGFDDELCDIFEELAESIDKEDENAPDERELTLAERTAIAMQSPEEFQKEFKKTHGPFTREECHQSLIEWRNSRKS